MKSFVKYSLIILTIIFAACSTIPPEAPILSEELGKCITSIEKANITLLHNYFSMKRQEVDRFIQESYIPSFANNIFSEKGMAEIWDAVVKENNPVERLKFILYLSPKIQRDISEKRLSLINPIDELERELAVKIQSAYDQAKSINNSITSFLASAAKVDENRNRYLSMLGIREEDIGNTIAKVDEAVGQLLTKSKDVADKVPVFQEYVSKINEIKKSIKGEK